MSIKNIGIIISILLVLLVVAHGLWNYGFSYRQSDANKAKLVPDDAAAMEAARRSQYYNLVPFLDLLENVREQNIQEDGSHLFRFMVDTTGTDSVYVIILPTTQDMDAYESIFTAGSKSELPPGGIYRRPVRDSLVELDNTLLFKIIEFGTKE